VGLFLALGHVGCVWMCVCMVDSNCIVDKNARVGDDVLILNVDNVQEAARPEEGFYIRTGVTVICKNSIIKSGTVI
jgi:glucose-1-phosphate adenylyltransferase